MVSGVDCTQIIYIRYSADVVNLPRLRSRASLLDISHLHWERATTWSHKFIRANSKIDVPELEVRYCL